MNTNVDIQSDNRIVLEDGIEVAVAAREFHSLTLDLSHDIVVAELQNMGAEAVDGPKADIIYIEHWEGAITVLVEDEVIAEDVRHRLATA